MIGLNDQHRRLLRELRSHRRLLSAVIALGILVAAVQPLSAKLTQLIIDSLKGGDDKLAIERLPLLLMLLFFAGGIAKYYYNTLRRKVVEFLVVGFRKRIFEKYLTLPVSYIDRQRSGEILGAIQNDLSIISQGADTLFGILKEPLAFLSLLGMAFYFDWKLALFTSLAAPIVVLLFSKPGAAVKRYAVWNLALFANLVSLAQEALAGTRMVKIFGIESTLSRKFSTNQDYYFRTAWKSIKVQELTTPLVELLGASLMALLLTYGGHRITAGTMSAGDLIGFILTLGLCQMPIKNLNNAYLKIKTAEAAADRIYSLLDATDEPNLGRRRLDSFAKQIQFQNVSLTYGEKWALKNVSFEILRGQCVAFVGPSGGGKSSLVNCLARFYDPSEGSISIDEYDIREYELNSLRSQISLVSQDIFLFHDTVFENIRYGNAMAARTEVLKAAELAYCMDFIGRLPQGLETVLGERGVCLSGGERQRIAIARAILKNAPILILDEATSNLDTQSERIVQKALESLMAGRTTLMVAHRYSVVARAEKIFVLKDGQIHEVGTSSELLELNGQFAKLFGPTAALL